MRYLDAAQKKLLVDVLASPLWAEVKRCLEERKQLSPDVKDEVFIAAAKGHRRTGFEEAIKAIEKLPFEFDETPPAPFTRPAVSITAD